MEEDFLSDKEQWERVVKWLREQGPWALAAVAVVATGYAGWHYWQSRQEQRYVSAASRYGALVEAFGSNNFDGGIKLADDLIKDFPSSGYADEANLAVARYQVEHGDLDKALGRLQQVLRSTKDPELALIARLRVARVQLALGKADDALKTLDEVNPGAFAARFAQARGDILMSKGDRNGALKAYQTARDGGDTVDGGLLDLKIDEAGALVSLPPTPSRSRRAAVLACTGALLAALVLSGCSFFHHTAATKKPKEDKKAAEKPAVLVPFRNRIEVKRVWSETIAGEKPKLRVSLRAAADDDHAFIASYKGELEALNLSTGKRLWKQKLKAPLSAGPSVAAGIVVVGSSKGEVIAVRESDGGTLWRAHINAEILSAPAVSEDQVVIRAVDGRIHGLSAKDGSENWAVDEQVPKLSLRGSSSPLLSGELAICGFDNGRVLAINSRNGTTVWDLAIGQAHGSTELARLIDVDAPVIGDGDDLYAAAFQGRVVHLKRETGEALWTRDLSSYRGMALDAGRLYVSLGDDSVTGLDRQNGTEQWSQKALARRQITAPTVYGGYVVVADADGVIHWLDPATGEFVARALVGKGVPRKGVESTKISYKRRVTAEPLVAGDLLLVFSDAGTLSAFRAQPASSQPAP